MSDITDSLRLMAEVLDEVEGEPFVEDLLVLVGRDFQDPESPARDTHEIHLSVLGLTAKGRMPMESTVPIRLSTLRTDKAACVRIVRLLLGQATGDPRVVQP